MLAILHRDARVGRALAGIVGSADDELEVVAVEDLAVAEDLLVSGADTVCVVDEGAARTPGELAAFIRAHPDVRFVVVAGRLPEATQYVEAGAVGIVEDDDAFATIAPVVSAVTSGLCAFPDQVVRRLLRHVRASGQSAQSAQRLARLSPREYEVVEHLTAGSDPAAIASALGVSVNTVRSHLKSIFRKLGVHSSTEAVVLAISAGVPPGSPERVAPHPAQRPG